MIKKTTLLTAAFVAYTATLFAQLPDMYREVDHVIWVVGNLKSVEKGWKKLGFSDIRRLPQVTLKVEHQPAIRARAAVANLGGLRVFWLEKDKMGGFLRSFHDENGDAILALVHSAGDRATRQTEVKRLVECGLQEMLTVEFNTNVGDLDYVFTGTRNRGKYEMALCDRNTSRLLFDAIGEGNNGFDLRFSQYAFAILEPEPVSDFWVGLGFPEIEITHPEVHDKAYYGIPADFSMDLGWQRHGRIVYEWCIPLSGPTVYKDHIGAKGEGLQHFGFNAEDIDAVIGSWETLGLVGSQSGGWGEKGKPGSGRFYYADTTPYGGVTIELLWNYRE